MPIVILAEKYFKITPFFQYLQWLSLAPVNREEVKLVNFITAPVTDMPDYFGPASFHENDYSFFYKNLQDNVAKRIAAYKAN